MTDFLITMMTLYPWFAFLLVFFAIAGLFYAAVWAHELAGATSDWLSYRRLVWRSKAVVRRRIADGRGFVCVDCMRIADENGVAAGDDPPEYQHPDGDDDDLTELWDEPPDDWSPAAEWGDKPWRSLGTLAEIVAALERMNDDDQLPDGPPRCSNSACFLYGQEHPGACDVAPTMPAACYTEGPAMPPQPVREYLHPQIMDDLSAAGFSEHETTDGAVESMFTRAQAREVQAMITDGVISSDETGRSH